MASLIRKPGSPFWYLSYRHKDGRWLKKSTELRADDPNDSAKAAVLRAEAEAREIAGGAHRLHTVDESTWDKWVSGFLDRHCQIQLTRERYEGSWKWLALWLRERGLLAPRQITYRMAVDFMEWRTAFKKRTGKHVGWNTARNDLKVLAIVMGEALKMEFIESNPLASLKGIPRKPAKRKPALTDEEIIFIREKLRSEPEWMQVAFEISLHTGCRLRETVIPLSRVDLAAGKLTFIPKGGEKRTFSIPLPTALRPIFELRKTENRKTTLELPFQPSRRWGQFLKKIGRPELVFHCLRVTHINRLRLAGVPREVAMRLVNHSSAAVHQIYQREEFEDLLPYRDAVQLPSVGGDTLPSPSRTRARGKRETPAL